jgi:hypothetical protein
VKVYLDDIVTFTKTIENHLALLDKVLTKLSEAGLKIRNDKCTFAYDSTEFLGYKVTRQEISISKDQIQASLDAPRPTNERRLLAGLVVLRIFDPIVAEENLVLNPLTNSFSWEGEEDSKLEELKHLLCEMMKNPKNMIPNPE